MGDFFLGDDFTFAEHLHGINTLGVFLAHLEDATGDGVQISCATRGERIQVTHPKVPLPTILRNSKSFGLSVCFA